ncbi:MAG: glycosyltransferase [Chloroflexota bacterium]
MPIRIALITPFPPIKSSIGQYGYYLGKALSQTGKFSEITLLTQIAPGAGSFDGVLPFRVERLWRVNRLDATPKILSRLNQIKPDLVWYNLGASVFGQSSLANLAGLLSPGFTRRSGTPTVVTLHELIAQADLETLQVPGGRLARWGASLIQHFYTQAGDVVCVTLKEHARYLSRRNPNLEITHIPHGAFFPPSLLADSPNPEILFFGYLAPFKGLELLLEAFQGLLLENSSVRLTIAGGEHPRFPGYMSRLRSAFQDNPAVRWLGYVPESGLMEMFGRAAVVVIPSLATTGSSSVLYRSATWGRSIVCSDLPELRAIAEEEGLRIEFFPAGDVTWLKNSLQSLLRDPARRSEQARHNFQMIKNGLTLDHTCKRYLQAFNRALEKRNSRFRIPMTEPA